MQHSKPVNVTNVILTQSWYISIYICIYVYIVTVNTKYYNFNNLID